VLSFGPGKQIDSPRGAPRALGFVDPLVAMEPDTNPDRRGVPDRRQEPTGPLDALPPAGMRMRARRADEHARPYFVDRFPPALLVAILLLLIASMADAVITVRLVNAGGSEINPIMERLLDAGVGPFLVGKFLLTAVGLPLLLIFGNFHLFHTRFRVKYLIPLFVGLYLVLIGYQLWLTHLHVA
jgi:hypothetical protein